VAVAKRHAGAVVTAVDVSADALAVAARNAARHGVAGRITFLSGDLFAPVPPGERFDFVLSNPQYVRREELANLPRAVREYEPHLALDGGPDGFAVFDRLVVQARDHLEAGGHLLVEIHAGQEEEARQRIRGLAGYDLAKTIPDGEGRPRVLHARWRPAG
jgi:release factor glutamine methyltransferase